jgi:hypothetical protein
MLGATYQVRWTWHTVVWQVSLRGDNTRAVSRGSQPFRSQEPLKYRHLLHKSVTCLPASHCTVQTGSHSKQTCIQHRNLRFFVISKPRRRHNHSRLKLTHDGTWSMKELVRRWPSSGSLSHVIWQSSPTFQRCLLPPSSGHPDDEGSKHL